MPSSLTSRTIIQTSPTIFFPPGDSALADLPKKFYSAIDPRSISGTYLSLRDTWGSITKSSNLSLNAAGLNSPVTLGANTTVNSVLPGFTLTYTDNFASIDTSRWKIYNNSTYGSDGGRIQTYMAANVVPGTGSAGATSGTSLRLLSQETDLGSQNTLYNRYVYTAGMLDTQTVSLWYPRYGRFEWRAKVPHGQGLWPSFWLTCRLGGATTCEIDILEYFHSQVPGKNSSTIHGKDNSGTFTPNRYTNNGNPANGVGGRTFFEAPTYTPDWHVWAAEILPVTDSTGNTLADPTQPNTNVRLCIYLDGVQVWRVVDTSALYWTTNGGSTDSFWNIYLQGCQIDGQNVGHPRDTLAYSHLRNACLISGTAPSSCAISTGSYTVQRAQFNDPASTTEIDYFKNWKYTG